MGIESDFSDIEDFFEQGIKEVHEIVQDVGDEAVLYAYDNGSYKDRTGKLRQSNTAESQNEGLLLMNDAEYASYVEAKGFEVLTGAALFAEKRLKEELE